MLGGKRGMRTSESAKIEVFNLIKGSEQWINNRMLVLPFSFLFMFDYISLFHYKENIKTRRSCMIANETTLLKKPHDACRG